MSVCDRIEECIMALLEEQQGAAELRRNELAVRIGCAPSQISYVISTRFSPVCGYLVESRRGGGGYIRIRRVDTGCSGHIGAVVRNELDGPVSERRANEIIRELVRGHYITGQSAAVLQAGVSNAALQSAGELADRVRSSVLAAMLMQCIKGED